MDFLTKLDKLMSEQGLNRHTLSKKCNIPYTTIDGWYKKGYKDVRLSTLRKLANYFCTTLDFWSDGTVFELNNAIKSPMNDGDPSISFPVIGDVAAHFGADAIEEDTGIRVDIPQSWIHGNPASDYFVLRVSGDSMFPDYQDGDYVLVKKQNSVDSGSVAIMLYDDLTVGTVKKVNYVPGENWLELVPRNPEYAVKRIENTEIEGCKVLGLVTRLIRIVND